MAYAQKLLYDKVSVGVMIWVPQEVINWNAFLGTCNLFRGPNTLVKIYFTQIMQKKLPTPPGLTSRASLRGPSPLGSTSTFKRTLAYFKLIFYYSNHIIWVTRHEGSTFIAFDVTFCDFTDVTLAAEDDVCPWWFSTIATVTIVNSSTMKPKYWFETFNLDLILITSLPSWWPRLGSRQCWYH